MRKLAEYRARLDSEPLTDNQHGRILAEFERLGFHPRYDRAERLRLTAILAGADPLGSTRDLTMGQAGRAVGLLTGCETVRDLYAHEVAAALAAAAAPPVSLLESLLVILRQYPPAPLFPPS